MISVESNIIKPPQIVTHTTSPQNNQCTTTSFQ